MTEPSIPDVSPAIKPRHGGPRPGAGRKRRPCSSCQSADQWVTVPGGRKVCPCDGSIRLREAIVAALNQHLQLYPATTTAVVRRVCASVVTAAAEVLPAGQPSRGGPS